MKERKVKPSRLRAPDYYLISQLRELNQWQHLNLENENYVVLYNRCVYLQ